MNHETLSIIQDIERLAATTRNAHIKCGSRRVDLGIALPTDVMDFFSNVIELVIYPTGLRIDSETVKECVYKDGSRFVRLATTTEGGVYYIRMSDSQICFGYDFALPWDAEPSIVASTWGEFIKKQIAEAYEEI